MADLARSVSVLSAVSSSVEQRLIALRFIQNYVTDPESASMPVVMRSRVNELVLDNILNIVMNEQVSLFRTLHPKPSRYNSLFSIINQIYLFDYRQLRIYGQGK